MIGAGLATLTELESSWSWPDLAEALAYLDARDEADDRARERARREADQARRGGPSPL